jgi:hypothetical protein
MKIEIDLDEFWPSASTLVGLEFETDEDFQRCQAILSEDWDLYRNVNPEQRYAIVRKCDEHLFSEAGLRYKRHRIIDLDELPPEERYRRERAMIDKYFPAFVERLKREQEWERQREQQERE